MVLFDQVQSLDVTGPLEVFTGANTWRARARRRPCLRHPHREPRRRDGADLERPAHHAGRGPARVRRFPPARRSSPGGPGRAGPADRARGRGIPAGRPGARRVAAARTDAARESPGLGVHGCLPARRGRAARRAAGHDPLGLLRRAGRADTRRSASRRTRSSSGTGTSPPRRGSPPGSTSRWPWWKTISAGTRRSRSPGTWWCSCAARATRPSSAPSWPGSWRTGSRCVTCSGGSPITRPRTCPWTRWPARPASPRGSSPAPSRPRWACRRAATSTASGSRRPGAAWRIPRTGSSRRPSACGYGTPEAMRRAFLRTLGVSPDEYRRRFRHRRPVTYTRGKEESHADCHPALRPLHRARRDRPLSGAQQPAGRGGRLRRRTSRARSGTSKAA